MTPVTVVLLCLTILGVSGRRTAALAEDTSASPTPVPAFYQWLEKYQNPTPHTGSQNSPQQTRPTPQRNAQRADQRESTPAHPSSLPVEDPSVPSSAGGSAEFAEPTGPGEGLGCFYHRSYYSHLPLFDKGNTYTLPGSLDVAEPYHKPMSGAAASSAGVSVPSARPR